MSAAGNLPYCLLGKSHGLSQPSQEFDLLDLRNHLKPRYTSSHSAETERSGSITLITQRGGKCTSAEVLSLTPCLVSFAPTTRCYGLCCCAATWCTPGVECRPALHTLLVHVSLLDWPRQVHALCVHAAMVGRRCREYLLSRAYRSVRKCKRLLRYAYRNCQECLQLIAQTPHSAAHLPENG